MAEGFRMCDGERDWCAGLFAGIGLRRVNSRQHVTLTSHAAPVASPITPCPTRALVQELRAVLERRLDLAFALILDPRLPLVADQPARHKVVVVGVENVFAPALGLEPLQEIVTLQNV